MYTSQILTGLLLSFTRMDIIHYRYTTFASAEIMTPLYHGDGGSQCLNDYEYRQNDVDKRSCAWIRNVESRRQKNCEDFEVKFHCPQTCGLCCEDDPDFKFQTDSGQKRTCQWLSKKMYVFYFVMCVWVSQYVFLNYRISHHPPFFCFCFIPTVKDRKSIVIPMKMDLVLKMHVLKHVVYVKKLSMKDHQPMIIVRIIPTSVIRIIITKHVNTLVDWKHVVTMHARWKIQERTVLDPVGHVVSMIQVLFWN